MPCYHQASAPSCICQLPYSSGGGVAMVGPKDKLEHCPTATICRAHCITRIICCFFFFLRRGSFNWKVLMKCGFGKSEGKMAEYTHTPTSTHPMHTPTCTRENDEIRGAGGKGVEASCTPSSRSSSSSSSSSSFCYCRRPC